MYDKKIKAVLAISFTTHTFFLEKTYPPGLRNKVYFRT